MRHKLYRYVVIVYKGAVLFIMWLFAPELRRRQQHIRNCRQLVRVGAPWAASLFLDDTSAGWWCFFFILLSRSVGCYMQRFGKGVPIFLTPSKF